MKCCEGRRTVYCPHCGNTIKKPGLAALLQHLAIRVTTLKSHIAWCKKILDEQGESGYRRADVEKTERGLAKWQCWHDELAVLLQAVETKQEETKT